MSSNMSHSSVTFFLEIRYDRNATMTLPTLDRTPLTCWKSKPYTPTSLHYNAWMALWVRANTVGMCYTVRRHLFNRSALYIFIFLCFYHVSHISQIWDMGKHIQKQHPRVYLFCKIKLFMVQILKITPMLFFIIYKFKMLVIE